MKATIAWIIIGFLLFCVFGLTFTKSPDAISALLMTVSKDVRTYSAVVHTLFIAVIVIGIFVDRLRTAVFSLFIAFLSLSASIVSVMYMILPNIMIFGLFFVLTVHAYVSNRLHFRFAEIPPIDMAFGVAGLVFGFWYLHWVESPVWFNALLYSPLGAVNCPTMITVCGFLCFSQEPRSAFLEVAVALITLYFGFFGLFRLDAFVDIALIACASFLIVRLTSTQTRHALLAANAAATR
jgi:hypothetical protein